MVHVRATTITLILAMVLKTELCALVISNSIVGCLYMIVERDILRETGTIGEEYYFTKKRTRLSFEQNILMNFLAHVLLSYIACKRCNYKTNIRTILVMYTLYMLFVDVKSVYPTSVVQLQSYICLHMCISGMLCLFALVYEDF